MCYIVIFMKETQKITSLPHSIGHFVENGIRRNMFGGRTNTFIGVGDYRLKEHNQHIQTTIK